MNSLELIKGKQIFPIVDEIRSHSYKLDKEYEYMDKRIQPITLDQLNELISAGYDCPSICCEGSILMRHPYLPNKIISFSADMGQFIHEKLEHYAAILNLLGAKSQQIKAECQKSEKMVVDAKGKVKTAKFSFKMKSHMEELQNDFDKRAVTIKAGNTSWSYEDALALAKEYGLENDSFIKNILAERHLRPIDSYKKTIEISHEFNSMMDIAANMSVMKNAFNLDGKFKKSVEVRQKVFISQIIYFV